MEFRAKITREIGKGNLIAFADVNAGGVLNLRGVRLMQGDRGLFIGTPGTEWKDRFGETRYTDVFSPIGKQVYAEMLQSVRDAYLEYRATVQKTAQTEQDESSGHAPRDAPAEDDELPFFVREPDEGGQSMNF